MLNYEEKTPLLAIEGKHYTVEAILLNTVTDYTDDLVTVSTALLYFKKTPALKGNVFFLRNIETGNAKVIITYSADFEVPELYIKENVVYLSTGGFDVEILDASNEDCHKILRDHLRKYAPKTLVTMSNTWGDCNGFSRVNSEFVRREIIASKGLGLDVAQIDDGWQTGGTATRNIFDENGRRRFDGDFWEMNHSRFPSGIEEMRDVARDNGIELGLWFAPDFHENFKHFDRDVAVLKNAHDNWNANYFKLDMLYINNREDKEKFIKMLEVLKPLGLLELDVTNGLRLGYIGSLVYGIIFMENRYTKTGNYYPYRTLKNLWELSAFIPSATLQVEIANPDLNNESYIDDPFRPEIYDMDYLFASVMVANPLFWMETQFLSEKRINELNRILPIWKTLREEFASADVQPILSQPSGRSFTGFTINGKSRYVLLLREDTCTDACDNVFGDFTVLCSNGTVVNEGGKIKLSKKNCYALLKLL